MAEKLLKAKGTKSAAKKIAAKKCAEQGLSRPDFDPPVGFYKTVICCEGTKSGSSRGIQLEMTIFERIIVDCQTLRLVSKLLKIVGRTNRMKFKQKVLGILRQDKILARTIFDKPNSCLQKYRLTAKDRALAAGKR